MRAAAEAFARPEELEPEALRSRLAPLAFAAGRDAGPAFVDALAREAPALLGWLLGFELEGAPPGFLRSYAGDAFCRFLHTLDVTPRPVAGPVLEIGSNPYLFQLLLRALFPEAPLSGANFFDHDVFSTRIGSARHRLVNARLGETVDFDLPTFNVETVHPYPFPAGSFDLVYFCETLEHLVVNPLRVFRELRRLLRPGGHLVVTLPNAVRLVNVAAMLAGRNFFDLYWTGNGIHGRHNREYTLAELRTLLERDGFEIVRAETRDRFDYDTVPIEAVDYSGPSAPLPYRKPDLEAWLRAAGGATADRGDNIYVVARRPHRTGSRAERPAPAAVEAGDAAGFADSDRLVSFLDEVTATGEGLRITGWAFFTDDDSGLGAPATLVLQGPSGAVAVASEPMSRSDVASAHGIDRDDVGFTALVPRERLPAGPFEIRLRLRTPRGAAVERHLARWASGG